MINSLEASSQGYTNPFTTRATGPGTGEFDPGTQTGEQLRTQEGADRLIRSAPGKTWSLGEMQRAIPMQMGREMPEPGMSVDALREVNPPGVGRGEPNPGTVMPGSNGGSGISPDETIPPPLGKIMPEPGFGRVVPGTGAAGEDGGTNVDYQRIGFVQTYLQAGALGAESPQRLTVVG